MIDTLDSLQKIELAEGTPTEAPQTVPPVKESKPMKQSIILPIAIVVVLAGVMTGYGISTLTASSDSSVTPPPQGGIVTSDEVTVGKTYGTEDEKVYPDKTEGIVQKGGIEGEGSHHLIRPGGASQTVYMTSAVIDLDSFIGDKVEVRGVTFSAQRAAWFMDVGSVKVLQLDAAPAASEPGAEAVSE